MRLVELYESSTTDEIRLAIDDIMSMMLSKGVKEMATDRFLSLLGKRGFILSPEELIQAADSSQMVTSVDREKITTSDQMDVDQSVEAPVDVGDMAADQAMKDIKK